MAHTLSAVIYLKQILTYQHNKMMSFFFQYVATVIAMVCVFDRVEATQKSQSSASSYSTSTSVASSGSSGFPFQEFDALDIDFTELYETLQQGSALPPEYLEALVAAIQERHLTDSVSSDTKSPAEKLEGTERVDENILI